MIVFSFMGASPPDPDQGLCPWTPLGASLPDPCIGSRSARSPYVSTPHCLTWRRPCPLAPFLRYYELVRPKFCCHRLLFEFSAMDTPVWGNDYPINLSVKLLSNYQINFGMCDHVTHGTVERKDRRTDRRHTIKPNTNRRRNSTRQLSCVGGVY